MSLSAGKLRHRVTLESQQQTQNQYGGIETTWVEQGRAWAEVAPQSGREYVAARQVQNEVTTRITIRYRDDIDATWRIRHRGRIFDIQAVLPDAGSGLAHLSLMCSESATDG